MGINKARKQIIIKGYANTNDIRSFMGCGHIKAKKIREVIEQQIIEKGKLVNPLGINPKHLLRLLELTEEQVFRYAEMEEQAND